MKSIIFLFALILSFVATAQDGSLDCLTRRQKEEIYKLVKINDLLETRKTQCDTIILTLEEQNRILGKKSTISDSIIAIQNRTISKKDFVITEKDTQLTNYASIVELKDQKIRHLTRENAKLDKAYKKEKRKKYIWGGSGLIGGVCIVLLFVL